MKLQTKMIIEKKQVIEKLKQDLSQKNIMALPEIVKVVINIGIGQSRINPKFAENAEKTLLAISGQKPASRAARKAIASFKIRQGEKIGLVVTLRGRRMLDFIIKVVNIVLPRIRDFRGLNPLGFDRKGNFSLGIEEQIVFPEISHEKAEILHGMTITIATSAKNPKDGKKLLEAWGFPFKKGK